MFHLRGWELLKTGGDPTIINSAPRGFTTMIRYPLSTPECVEDLKIAEGNCVKGDAFRTPSKYEGDQKILRGSIGL